MTTRTVALLLSSAVSVALSLAAFAEPAPAPAPAAAAPGSPSDENSIAEIVVTAEKRNESLETVPVAISAYTSKSRDLLGIETIQDMTNFTPGLAYSTSLDRAFIRGIGRETNNLSTNPGVATYSDGVYNSSVVAASGDAMFEDRIEVLRGPQGTLYGRNAIAGTINSISKRPSSEWTAEVRAKWGNFGTYDFEGKVSGPISDTMRVSFGGYRNTQEDGYYRNIFNGKSEGFNLSNGNFFYWEGQFEWDITPDLNFWMRFDQLGYHDAYRLDNVLGSYDYAAYPSGGPLTPGAAFGAASQAGVLPSAVNPILPTGFLPNAPQCVTNPGNNNIFNYCADDGNTAKLSRTYQVTPQLTWHTPWAADLKYLGAYTTYYYNLFNENDGTAIESYVFPVIPGTKGCVVADCPPLTVFPQSYSDYFETKKYFSNEIDVSSHSDSPLQWIAGLFQYNERNAQSPGNGYLPDQPQLATPVVFNAAGVASPAAPNPTQTYFFRQAEMHDNSYAAFAQTDWTFAPTWKLTTGLRYTYDILKGGEQFRELCFGLPGCLGNVFGPLPPAYILGAFTPVNDITAANDPAIFNCFNGVGCKYPGVRGTPYLEPNGNWARDLGASWRAPTGTIGLEWTPDPNTLAYLKYSRGYKSGGFNASEITVNPESLPEHLDAFEFGGKEVFNRTLQVNGALFYYNYKDKQIPLTVEGFGGGPNISSIVNIPKVQSYGAEFETIWQPWTDMQILLDYSYLSAVIKGQAGSCAPPAPAASCFQNAISGAFENTNGNSVPESPRSKIAANANYTWRFTPGSLNYSVSYVYKDKTHDSIFAEDYYVAPAYSQVDMRLSWNDSADRFTVFAYLKNLQNKLGYDGVDAGPVTTPAPGTQACGFNGVQPYYCQRLLGLTPPRTYGVEVQYRLK
jgi:iron complex outermembrane recepter protein